MSAALDPALVERMVALVRDLHADHVKHGAHDYVQDFVARTAAIVAELPKPIDPDLIEAREMAEALGWASANRLEDLRTGRMDDFQGVKALLDALKRGRELQREASRG